MAPADVLRPITPQCEAGRRPDPPPSVPSAIGVKPAASAAAAPPEEPPGVSAVFIGCRVGPYTLFSVWPLAAISGVLVMPRKTPPAAFRRSTETASRGGMKSFHSREPLVTRRPETQVLSFTV